MLQFQPPFHQVSLEQILCFKKRHIKSVIYRDIEGAHLSKNLQGKINVAIVDSRCKCTLAVNFRQFWE